MAPPLDLTTVMGEGGEADQEDQELEIRQCYICLESEDLHEDDVIPGRWVSPCKCTGSTRWVHAHCIRRWVRQVEATSPGRSVACPQCLTPYTILPHLGPIVQFLILWNQRFYVLIKIAVGTFFVYMMGYTTCTALGLFANNVVYSVDETHTLMATKEIQKVTIQLHMVGVGLLLINYPCWSDWILWGLRKASLLPVLGRVLPEDAPPGYRVPTSHWIRLSSIQSLLVDAAVLPVCAKVVGEVLFSSVESPIYRVLYGGAVFLSVKGILHMYYKQKVMVRHKRMTILPYQEPVQIQATETIEEEPF